MHETGIARNILRIATESVLEHEGPGARLASVEVRVGLLSGVDANALSFAFGALAEGDSEIWTDLDAPPTIPTKGARLLVIPSIPSLRCEACGANDTPDTLTWSCPECASPRIRLEGGRELEITALEVEHDPRQHQN
ncbi:MAG: hypothetical protein CME06_01255 [Gemmatimonadetes bacterium]|nr:hypothetical protein [Gemmatimonadota bacterium]